MNPSKVNRHNLHQLTDLPNIGKASVNDLKLLGIYKPQDLIGKNGYAMYDQLCELTGQRHDPCVLDVFLSIVDFIHGAEPKPWWKYTEERKEYLRRNAGS